MYKLKIVSSIGQISSNILLIMFYMALTGFNVALI